MKPTFFLLLLLTSLLSCGIGENRQQEVYSDFDETTVTQDVEVDKEQMPYKGELVKTVRWQDQAGWNTLILSELPAYSVDDDMSRTEFYGYLYRDSKRAAGPVWQFKDVLDSCYCDCAIDLVDRKVLLKDIDQDGTAEPHFLLFLNDLCDVSPMPTRLRLFSGNQALQVNGWVNIYLDEGIELPRGRISSGSAQMDTAIVTYAMDVWDAFVEEKKRQLRQKEKAGN